MTMASEFKEFIAKGNMMDLAVGVIIGAAFGKIVASLVNDILMPIVGLFLGGLDFKQLFVTLGRGSYDTLAAAEKAGAAVLRYGNFMQAIVDFLIIAVVIFIIIKQVNRMKKQPPAAAPLPPEDVLLLREIRDALRK